MKINPTFILPQALLLDMDDTLTEPMLDYAAIRADIGIGNEPILEAISRMEARRLTEARAILERHELTAAHGSTLSRGCRELLAWLSERELKTALVTRNSRQCVDIVLDRHGLQFDAVVSRDDAPHKPDPAALHLACRTLNVASENVWMVGDSRFDIEAGLAAGIPTVWLSLGRQRPFAAEPWRVVNDLIELREMLEKCAANPPLNSDS
jgi:HAD superfamily hydrolase (TIGR01549 family)